MITHNGSSSWLFRSAWPLDRRAADAANAHQQQLAKRPGALGELERIAERVAAWQGREDPRLEHIVIRVFAADHGVCAKGVSAFPQATTAQMIVNCLQGGAAISVFARDLKADLQVYNLGTVSPLPVLPGLRDYAIAPETGDFSEQAAMSPEALVRALRIGAESVPEGPLHLFIGGEMGIGNTTTAAALVSALLTLPVEIAVGPGARRAKIRELVSMALEIANDNGLFAATRTWTSLGWRVNGTWWSVAWLCTRKRSTPARFPHLRRWSAWAVLRLPR